LQTNCPQCSQKLVVEDDKIPAGPFMLRCPKCQMALKLPGKGGATAANGAPPAGPVAVGNGASQTKPSEPPSVPSPPAMSPPASTASTPPPPTRSEEPEGGKGRALVLVDHQDPSVRDAVQTLLQKNGYGVDTAAQAQQGVQMLERNSYALVLTTPNGTGQGEVSLYKRVVALAPEIRRNLFFVLVGDKFSTGDGTQAFSAMADLVLNSKDVGSAEDLLRSTVAERERIYQPFLEAQVRLDRRKY